MWKVFNSFATSCSLLSGPRIIEYNTTYKCLRQVCNTFTTSVRSLAKGFVEGENKFAHQIMELNPSYTSTLLSVSVPAISDVGESDYDKIIATDWTQESPSNVCQAFQTVSQISSIKSLPITDEALDRLAKTLTTYITLYTDQELSVILQSLALWPQTDTLNSHNYVEIWSTLDKECVSRAKNWNNEQLLYYADHFYTLHLLRVTKFMKMFMRKLTAKPKRLTPSQLVQFMFYANVCRSFKPSTSAYDIEYQLEKCIDSLSLDEIAILAMGFFKTQTRIHMPELFTKMIERTIKEVDSVNEITLSALVKTFRYSLPLSHADMLHQLLDKLVPNIPRLSTICCLHIALAGTNTQIYHEEVIRKIAQKFVDEIQQLRVKDLERIAFALTLFDLDPKTTPCIYEEIVRELGREERREELEKYPKCLPSCLHFLSLRKIFPEELISQALDQEFITKTYGNYHGKIGREILCLDTTVAIEYPEYTKNHLSEDLRHLLGRNHVHPVPDRHGGKRLTVAETMYLDIAENIGDLLKDSKYVYMGNVIPNSQKPDIVFVLDGNKSPLEVPDSFCRIEMGDVKQPAELGADVTWHCVVIGGWNSYIRGSEKPLGSLVMKLRQLDILGFKSVLIPWYDWRQLGASERQEYLKRRIFDR